MTASERLKALNERRSTEDMVTYHDALPEIIAVIEAMEEIAQTAWGDKDLALEAFAKKALAALEEKLS